MYLNFAVYKLNVLTTLVAVAKSQVVKMKDVYFEKKIYSNFS